MAGRSKFLEHFARQWLALPSNPDGSHNQLVLRPWRNADDLTDKCSDTWIIDFPAGATEAEAKAVQAPFEHLRRAWHEQNQRLLAAGEPLARANEPRLQRLWWLMQRPRPHLRRALSNLSRYIATPRVGKYRTFVYLPRIVIPDTRLVAIARADDECLGILQSRIHEVWSLRFGGRHSIGNDPEYIHTEVFETYPFPEGMTPNIPADDYAADPRSIAIAAAAKRLINMRDNWLNPPELIRRVAEVVPGYPDRILPKDDAAAVLLPRAHADRSLQ